MEVEIQKGIDQLDNQVINTINSAIQIIQKSVTEKGERLMNKLNHQTAWLRKHLFRPNILLSAVEKHIKTTSLLYSPLRSFTISHFPSSGNDVNILQPLPSVTLNEVLPIGDLEIESYILLLVVIACLDNQKYPEAFFWAQQSISRAHLLHISTDALIAKLYFYYERAAELCKVTIIDQLLIAHTTATLRQANETKATLTNLIVRCYLATSQYSVCEKFITKSLINQSVSNQQQARYYYYLGRIQCIHLKYSDAYDSLTTAIRKAPQLPKAYGFHVCVTKWLTLVQLLMGEIPRRNVFLQNGMLKALLPYYRLTQAVQIGDLEEFKKVVEEFKDWFTEDKTNGLVIRIRQNVIKTAIRKIYVSYSRIGLSEIQKKLQLDSVEDTEFIVAKCIQDNVIDAVIDHKNQILIGKNTLDIYTSNEPQIILENRIRGCMQLQRDIEKAMIFEDNTKRVLESGAYFNVDIHDNGIIGNMR
ncbi:26S proteasome regulatory subunit S3, putative [Entamoeba dispar SAW760]|uniref:26S proteasome regulatory subunit S3, putative n=1 Tax=Entamoeba dispar (strain ATCC PRA-260 / SAW760) TaxID=370354 RepID=B0EJI1_ENTDS|nr:26S proteasome regulatory subunit S3, putative [Entamoeba dispar SAW760]EDR25303.1 26S proteasome regulatory subunit S3, putative [Entamoeba dispar SAW760]|eukprot:EDR25303.1 26S proteasome regulatory subunit S3, putative [Entamoeba dispar SAW760]